MKFDVVVGNPPYQENSTKNNKGTNVYNYFYDLAESISDVYCLISPSRFLFDAGLTPKAWNKKMLNDPYLKVLHYSENPTEIFPNTDIKGGVAIIFRNSFEKGSPILKFIPNETLRSISRRFTSDEKTSLTSIIVGGRSALKLNSNFIKSHPESASDRLSFIQLKRPDVKELAKGEEYEIKTSTFSSLPYAFHKHEPEDKSLYWKILGLHEGKRVYRWLEKRLAEARIPSRNNLEKFKVFVPKAYGNGVFGEGIQSPIIGKPGVTCTPTFISIGFFDTFIEAENLVKYIKSKLVISLVGILKVTQDNTPSKWKYVPLQDFTEKSDIDWNCSQSDLDAQLYDKYGLSEKEIAFIEEKVKPME